MKKELKIKVLQFYNNTKCLKETYKQFKGQVYPDTIKRWIDPNLNESAKQKSLTYHNKNKNNLEYKEKRRLQSQKHRKTTKYKTTWKKLYNETKEKRKKLAQQHRLDNLEIYKERARDNYLQNKKRYRKWSKKYYKNNKEKLHNLELQRYHNDPITNLKHNLRVSLNRALKYKATKNNKALKYLGCTIDAFKKYIEERFDNGMSWDNRNKWHLDHIIPLSTIKEGYSLEKLCHYTNFQPLWKKDNLSKSKSFKKDQE
jgi:hypothetical protein